MFYDQDVRDAVRARDAQKQEMTAHDFGMHLCIMYGYDAERAVGVMKRCVTAGLLWIGQTRPRRGRPDYVVLTGLGRKLVESLTSGTS